MTSRQDMTASRIYFAQHGLAVDKTVDPQRPLSEQGITQTQAVAGHLLQADINIAKIFHSGKLRARQTAEIFASILSVDDITGVNGFSPNDDAKQTITQLTDENALYIGHLPHLDKLASLLVSGDESSSVCHFQNSAVICIETDDSNMGNRNYAIKWYLNHELLAHQ